MVASSQVAAQAAGKSAAVNSFDAKYQQQNCEGFCLTSACSDLSGSTLSYECGSCDQSAKCNPSAEDYKLPVAERKTWRERRKARRALKKKDMME